MTPLSAAGLFAAASTAAIGWGYGIPAAAATFSAMLFVVAVATHVAQSLRR